mgnify:CR=1 FL=1
MSEAEISWSQYDKAYKSIHDAIISGLSSPPIGKKITKYTFAWNADGTLAILKAFDGEQPLFTLNFEWNNDGMLKQVSRS